MTELLDSEQVYVDLFARTGKWRVPRIAKIALDEGVKQRAFHKGHRAAGLDRDACPCSGCKRQRAGFTIDLDFVTPFVEARARKKPEAPRVGISNQPMKVKK